MVVLRGWNMVKTLVRRSKIRWLIPVYEPLRASRDWVSLQRWLGNRGWCFYKSIMLSIDGPNLLRSCMTRSVVLPHSLFQVQGFRLKINNVDSGGVVFTILNLWHWVYLGPRSYCWKIMDEVLLPLNLGNCVKWTVDNAWRHCVVWNKWRIVLVEC